MNTKVYTNCTVVEDGHLGGYILNGDRNGFCQNLFDELISFLKIRSMADIGCGEGHLTKYFIDKGIKAIGIDGSVKAINTLAFDKSNFILHDYTKAPLIIPHTDLGISIEFVEHVDSKYIDNFIATFKCCNYIFFTHAFPNQYGYHHVNCQTSEYWIKLLQDSDFIFMEEYTKKLRALCTNTNEEGFFLKQSGLFFKNENKIC